MTIASQELIARDSAVMSPSLSRVLPLVVESASGSWITDVEGHRYLDFAAGIAVTALGHSHPAVLDAVTQQVQRFVHVSGGPFYYEHQAALAEELAAPHPPGRTSQSAVHQLRHRSRRSSAETRPLPHAPSVHHLLPRRVPRPHSRRPVGHAAQGHTACWVRHSGTRHDHRALCQRGHWNPA